MTTVLFTFDDENAGIKLFRIRPIIFHEENYYKKRRAPHFKTDGDKKDKMTKEINGECLSCLL